LTWGDQQILEPLDEIANVQVIAYDRKRKVVMRITTKKRRLTLDSALLVTTEEMLVNKKNVKMTELNEAGMAITDATFDREIRDEKEVVVMKKELDHLHHQVEYYHNSTQA
jgi:hypothetical protein